MESVKIIAIDAKNMDAYCAKKGYNITAPWISLSNALDSNHVYCLVPEFIEDTINEMESQGWYFVKLLHHDGCMMFRNTSDLRNIARELIAEGKI